MAKLRTMRAPAYPDKRTTRAAPVSLAPLSTEAALGALLKTPVDKLKIASAPKPKRKRARK